MANYIEEYNILGRQYGIEDFKAPGEHFFNGLYITGKRRPRYMLWAGGGGIGQAKDLVMARSLLYAYILKTIQREHEEVFTRSVNISITIRDLANGLASLNNFKVQTKKTVSQMESKRRGEVNNHVKRKAGGV